MPTLWVDFAYLCMRMVEAELENEHVQMNPKGLDRETEHAYNTRVKEISRGLFRTRTDLLRFIAAPTQWRVYIADQLACGEDRVTDFNLEDAVYLIIN